MSDAITVLGLLTCVMYQIHRQSRTAAPMNLLERLLLLWAAVCMCRLASKIL